MLSPVGRRNAISPEVATTPLAAPWSWGWASTESARQSRWPTSRAGEDTPEAASPRSFRIAVEGDGDAVTAWQRRAHPDADPFEVAALAPDDLAGRRERDNAAVVDADGDAFAWKCSRGQLAGFRRVPVEGAPSARSARSLLPARMPPT